MKFLDNIYNMKNNQTMKASELRIGNLVLLTKDSFKTSNVYQLDGFDIYKSEESECFDIKPIPLTEEWLLRIGFDEWSKDNWKTRNSLNKHGWSKEFNYYLPYNSLSTYTGNIIIHHVHQLQNLYFALTNQELEIKES